MEVTASKTATAFALGDILRKNKGLPITFMGELLSDGDGPLRISKFVARKVPSSNGNKAVNKVVEKIKILKSLGVLAVSEIAEDSLHYDQTGSSFVSVVLNTRQPDLPDLDVRQHLYIRGFKRLFDPKDQAANALPETLTQEPKSLIIGPCLFTSGSITAIQEDGLNVLMLNPFNSRVSAKIERIIIRNEFSFYELECMSRVLSVVLSTNAPRLSMNIPSVTYYAYPLEAYECGFMPPKLMLGWCNEIDKRRDMVKDTLKATLESTGMKVNLGMNEPLEGIRDYMRNSFEMGRKLKLSEAFGILENGSELWKLVLSDYQERPLTWKELGYMSYVMAYMSESMQMPVVALENPTEYKIFDRAIRLAKRLKLPLKLEGAIYPHEQVLVGEKGSTHSDIYLTGFTIADSDLGDVTDMLKELYGVRLVLKAQTEPLMVLE